ncbi:hypothetical protein K7432_012245 [Basidiobolus ranarum]|uniref:Uncharacterized protein n=1 Tax=Basidiobolus ranarum TaxID=34480 RepID=A0ABR2VSK3_9FUNG
MKHVDLVICDLNGSVSPGMITGNKECNDVMNNSAPDQCFHYSCFKQTEIAQTLETMAYNNNQARPKNLKICAYKECFKSSMLSSGEMDATNSTEKYCVRYENFNKPVIVTSLKDL